MALLLLGLLFYLSRALRPRTRLRAILLGGDQRIQPRYIRIHGACAAPIGGPGSGLRILYGTATSHRSARVGVFLLPTARPTGQAKKVVSDGWWLVGGEYIFYAVRFDTPQMAKPRGETRVRSNSSYSM